MSVPLSSYTQFLTLEGPVGVLEAAYDEPAPGSKPLRGMAVIGHPHPLQGGTMDNKVVQTLARALIQLGYATLRFNFRGVGKSLGSWDEGRGEVDDMQSVVNYARALPQAAGLPMVLAGFSFGSFIAARVAQLREQAGEKVERLVLVGVAASRFQVTDVPEDTLVIHGEQDDVVPLAAVMNWARPQHLPVVVVPGVGHFFHGQLPLLKKIVLRNWLSPVPSNETAA